MKEDSHESLWWRNGQHDCLMLEAGGSIPATPCLFSIRFSLGLCNHLLFVREMSLYSNKLKSPGSSSGLGQKHKKVETSKYSGPSMTWKQNETMAIIATFSLIFGWKNRMIVAEWLIGIPSSFPLHLSCFQWNQLICGKAPLFPPSHYFPVKLQRFGNAIVFFLVPHSAVLSWAWWCQRQNI